MLDIINRIDNRGRMILGAVAVAVLLVIIFARSEEREIIVESSVETRLEDIGDMQIERSIYKDIIDGVNKVVEYKGRKFAVLTTGGNSASDIEYSIDYGFNGEVYIRYWYGIEDGLFNSRSKVIEVYGDLEKTYLVEAVNRDMLYTNSTLLCIASKDDNGKYRLFSSEIGAINDNNNMNLGEGVYLLELIREENEDNGDSAIRIINGKRIAGITVRAIVKRVYENSTNVLLELGNVAGKGGEWELGVRHEGSKLEEGRAYKFFIGYDNNFYSKVIQN